MAITRFLIACAASMAVAAQANPIVFTNTSYATSAVATAEGVSDFHSATSPPTALNILSSATVIGQNDDAFSTALAGLGLLSTFAEADSFVGKPSASGESDFTGTILGYGTLKLLFNFVNASTSGGTGDFFVLLTNSVSGTLVNADFNAAGSIPLQFSIPKGSTTTLSLTLFSDAEATGPGQSVQNSSTVTLSSSSSIPLPATPFLLIAGLGAMFAARRNKRENGAAA